jgi:hypothetical protein
MLVVPVQTKVLEPEEVAVVRVWVERPHHLLLWTVAAATTVAVHVARLSKEHQEVLDLQEIVVLLVMMVFLVLLVQQEGITELQVRVQQETR